MHRLWPLALVPLLLVACPKPRPGSVRQVAPPPPSPASQSALPGFAPLAFSVTRQGNGALRIFGKQADSDVWSIYQDGPNGNFVPAWVRSFDHPTLDKAATTPLAALRSDGQLEVVWSGPNGGSCHGVQPLGPAVTFLACDGATTRETDAIIAEADGHLVLSETHVGAPIGYWRRLKDLSAASPDNWADLGRLAYGGVAPVTVFLLDQQGLLHAFFHQSAGPAIAGHIHQNVPNGTDWSSAELLGTGVPAVPPAPIDIDNPWLAAGLDNDGTMVTVVNGQDGAFWSRSQTAATPSGSWGPWTRITGQDAIRSPVLVQNADRRLELFGFVASTGTVVSCAQTVVNGPFGAWAQLLDGAATPIAAIANTNGRLEVFARSATTGFIQHRRQATPGTW